MKFKITIQNKKTYKSTAKIVEAKELEAILLKDGLNIKGFTSPDWYKADKISNQIKQSSNKLSPDSIVKIGKRNYYYISFAE